MIPNTQEVLFKCVSSTLGCVFTLSTRASLFSGLLNKFWNSCVLEIWGFTPNKRDSLKLNMLRTEV